MMYKGFSKSSKMQLPHVYTDMSFSNQVDTKGVPLVFSIFGSLDVDQEKFLPYFIYKLKDYHSEYPEIPIVILLTLNDETNTTILTKMQDIRDAIPTASIEVIALLTESWDSFLQNQIPATQNLFQKFEHQISSVYILNPPGSEASKTYSRAAYIAYFAQIIIFAQPDYESDQSELQHIKDWKTGLTQNPYSSKALTLGESSQGYIEVFQSANQAPEKTFSPDSNADNLTTTLKHVNEFNSSSKIVHVKAKQEIDKSLSYVHKAFSELSPYIVNTFATADVLAGYYQKKRFLFMKVLIGAAIFSIVAWEFYGGLVSDLRFLSLLLFASGYCVASFIYLMIIQRSKLDNNFLDARSMAEAIRVQMQWILVGSPLIASEWYIRKQSGDMRWINFALNSIQVMTARNHKVSRHECIEISYRHWVKKQRQYFNKSAIPKNKRKVAILDHLTRLFFILGILLIGLQFSGYYFPFIKENMLQWLIPLTALMPTAAGLINAYIEMEALRDQLNIYLSMSSFYQRGESALRFLFQRNTGWSSNQDDDEEAIRILEELGKESLEENSQWLNLRRERPLHVFS